MRCGQLQDHEHATERKGLHKSRTNLVKLTTSDVAVEREFNKNCTKFASHRIHRIASHRGVASRGGEGVISTTHARRQQRPRRPSNAPSPNQWGSKRSQEREREREREREKKGSGLRLEAKGAIHLCAHRHSLFPDKALHPHKHTLAIPPPSPPAHPLPLPSPIIAAPTPPSQEFTAAQDFAWTGWGNEGELVAL